MFTFGPAKEANDYCTQVVADLATIGHERWNALVAADRAANLFVRYEYLHALHATGCASRRTGWTPQFLTLWRGTPQTGALVGAVPLYRKDHSFGEYVFDWSWADASHRLGRAYYPKLLAAVPFTPVAGTRLIAADEAARAQLADALFEHARADDCSSLHVLFAPAAQNDLLVARGLLRRHGVQFHWRNAGYADFDAFLAALAQPKRKKIRAERRKVHEAGVALERKTGHAITAADWSFFYRCYRTTYAEHGSTPYLNQAFFEQLGAALPDHVLLVIARHGRRPIAASLGLFDATHLWGRYWGALEPVSCLHFECCYYQMIEFAIERRLQVFEGGAQGSHKLARGLDPVATESAHWLADRRLHDAVAHYLQREATAIGETLDELNEHRAFAAAAAGAKSKSGAAP
ncbi:MAG TPA: GNAT family N-acetyltransferase [Burkholderiaceae bacterium]|nr:GNAT family N-acetyltransferase [Burkholderiaceae bacterium]